MSDDPLSGIFRDVNERIADIAGAWDWGEYQGFLCECARPDCTEAVELSRSEYEAIRAVPVRFFTLLGHERADQERVVERHDGYVVVEKLGQAGRDAELEDPRARNREAEG